MKQGVTVGPGNTESGALWSGGGELSRARTEALSTVQVYVGIGCKGWLFLETKTGLDKSQWVFPDDHIE